MLLDQKNSGEANGGDDDLTIGNSKEQAPSNPKLSNEIKPRPIKISPKESNNDPLLRKLRKLKEIGKEAALSEPFESTPLLAQRLESSSEEGSTMLDELIETGEAPKTSAGGGRSAGWNDTEYAFMGTREGIVVVMSVHHYCKHNFHQPSYWELSFVLVVKPIHGRHNQHQKAFD